MHQDTNILRKNTQSSILYHYYSLYIQTQLNGVTDAANGSKVYWNNTVNVTYMKLNSRLTIKQQDAAITVTCSVYPAYTIQTNIEQHTNVHALLADHS